MTALPRPKGLLRRALREPLILFLVLGGVLFAANTLVSPALGIGSNPRRIEVSRSDLVRFLENRARVFDEDAAMHRYDTMSRAERQELLQKYIQEEALYREALNWQLVDQDYVIRRRLVQTLEYAIGNDVQDLATVSEAQGRRWYDEHKELYAQRPEITFSHVYFRDEPGAAERAAAALAQLRHGKVDWMVLGDRFPYSRSYSSQSQDLVADVFGEDMARRLFAGSATGRWIGPLRSPSGLHLVYLDRVEKGSEPSFEQVRGQAMADAAENARRKAVEAEVRRVVGSYRVALDRDLGTLE